MTNFNIKVVSDTVCPWCFVGKRRLEKAIAMWRAKYPNSEDSFSTNWYPFYLNPDAPRKGTDKRQLYYRKFGEQRATMAFQTLTQIGKEEGINFSFGGLTGSTRDSHRLIQLAKAKSAERQTDLIEALFQAYFENEQDITSHDVLLRAGVRAGLDEQEVKDLLASDRGGDEVDSEAAMSRDENIGGVPHFTIQDRFELSGAQEPAAFLQLFERVKAVGA